MITTIPELNEFLAAKTKRLDAEAERVRLQELADQQLIEGPRLASMPVSEIVDALIDAVTPNDESYPPSAEDIVDVLADFYGEDHSTIYTWLNTLDFQTRAA